MAYLYHLTAGSVLNTTIAMPGSKSESNRALLIHHLSHHRFTYHRLSNCHDVIHLKKALEKGGKEVNVKDSGTALRFLIACYCITNKNKIITGTARLCQRPVGHLVDALRMLGFKINYVRNEGYPPVEIVPIENRFLKQKTIVNPGESSQYVSALLLIAPLLPLGMEIHLNGAIVSEPYIRLTIEMMQQAGIVISRFDNILRIARQDFKPVTYEIEGDWSAAAVWYAFALFAREARIELRGLRQNSFQGDSILKEWMIDWGIETTFNHSGAVITKTRKAIPDFIELDCRHHPDLVQSLLVMAAVKNIKLKLNGVKNLRIKETDRLKAMETELVKLNARLEMISDDTCILYPSFRLIDNRFVMYNDHRMVLAFAPLSAVQPVTIEDPLVVSKSYPSFWDDFKKAGVIS